MNIPLAEIVTAYVLPVFQPLLLACLMWLALHAARLLHIQVSTRQRELLEDAIHNGLQFAANRLPPTVTLTGRVGMAASYIVPKIPATLAALGISRDQLEELITARVPAEIAAAARQVEADAGSSAPADIAATPPAPMSLLDRMRSGGIGAALSALAGTFLVLSVISCATGPQSPQLIEGKTIAGLWSGLKAAASAVELGVKTGKLHGHPAAVAGADLVLAARIIGAADSAYHANPAADVTSEIEDASSLLSAVLCITSPTPGCSSTPVLITQPPAASSAPAS